MPGKWTVAELEPGQYADWDRFVDISPQGSAFSKTAHLEACQANFRILACFRSGELAGGIVLTRSKWGKYTNPPITKYLGILMYPFEGSRYQAGTSERKVQSVLVESIGSKRKFEYLFHPAYTDWLPWHWAGFKQTTRYTYRIHFGDRADHTDNYNSRLRGKINKADRDANVRVVEEVDFATTFELLKKSFEAQGRKYPLKKSWVMHYLESAVAAGLLSCSGLADASGEVTCVLGIVHDRNAHYLVLNGVDYDRVEAGHNEWLIDQAIGRAAEAGAAIFDFEGSMIKPVESFYRQFGGRLDPYFSIRS